MAFKVFFLNLMILFLSINFEDNSIISQHQRIAYTYIGEQMALIGNKRHC